MARFSTALAAARLMKLDPEKTRHAVNIAGVNCAAFRQARVGELSHWKGRGFCQRPRVMAFTRPARTRGDDRSGADFEGQMGSKRNWCVVRQARRGLRQTPSREKCKRSTGAMILNTSIKYWPAEYHSQSAIEAAMFLRQEIGTRRKFNRSGSRVMTPRRPHRSEPEKWKRKLAKRPTIACLTSPRSRSSMAEVTEKQFQPARFTRPNNLKFLENVTVQRNDELTSLYAKAVATSCTSLCGWRV